MEDEEKGRKECGREVQEKQRQKKGEWWITFVKYFVTYPYFNVTVIWKQRNMKRQFVTMKRSTG